MLTLRSGAQEDETSGFDYVCSLDGQGMRLTLLIYVECSFVQTFYLTPLFLLLLQTVTKSAPVLALQSLGLLQPMDLDEEESKEEEEDEEPTHCRC